MSAPSSDSAQRSAKSPEALATPLVVGVTGHRDLLTEDIGELASEVDGFLNAVQELIPHSSMTVMCGMAEGADALVAARALERGLTVRAVLPMPLALYEEDFTTEGLKTLNETLAKPGVEVVELALPPDLDEAAVAGQGAARDRLYENLAAEIITSSNVLLALWDGEATGLVAGTSDVVARYLGATSGFHAIAQVAHSRDAANDAPPFDPAYVCWIPTRRNRDGPVAAEARGGPTFLVGGDGAHVWRESELPGELADQLAERDGYNALYAELQGAGKLAESGGLLADTPIDSGDPYRPALERIDREYSRSDALAIHFQGRSDRLFNLTAAMAATMGIVFLLFAKIVSFTGFLLIYLALFALGLLAFRVARRRQWLSRHLTYRALAETMRTRFFLVVADAHRAVDVHELMATTGTHRLPGFALIDGIVRATEPPPGERRDRRDAGALVDYVREAWVADQAAYFRSKIGRLARSQHRTERVKLLFIGVFVAATIALIFAKDPLSGSTIFEFAADGKKKPDEPVSVKTLLIFIMGALPFLLGVWELHNNKLATKELLWQYRNQADYFGAAERELSMTEDVGGRRDVIARLGRKSLAEGYQWAMYRFHREHEPPVAG